MASPVAMPYLANFFPRMRIGFVPFLSIIDEPPDFGKTKSFSGSENIVGAHRGRST